MGGGWAVNRCRAGAEHFITEVPHSQEKVPDLGLYSRTMSRALWGPGRVGVLFHTPVLKFCTPSQVQSLDLDFDNVSRSLERQQVTSLWTSLSLASVVTFLVESTLERGSLLGGYYPCLVPN